MEPQFIPQAIELVQKAIEADNAADYPTALSLYKRSLDYFMTGMKYEKVGWILVLDNIDKEKIFFAFRFKRFGFS